MKRGGAGLSDRCQVEVHGCEILFVTDVKHLSTSPGKLCPQPCGRGGREPGETGHQQEMKVRWSRRKVQKAMTGPERERGRKLSALVGKFI